MLAEDWGVAADVWSATSWTELRREALACDEHNLLNPDAEQRVPYVTQALSAARGRSSRSATTCGRSRTRSPSGCRATGPRSAPTASACPTPAAALRRHFHVDAASITLAVLTQLAKRGELNAEVLREAIARYHLKNGVTEAGGAESNDTQSMGHLIPAGRVPLSMESSPG